MSKKRIQVKPMSQCINEFESLIKGDPHDSCKYRMFMRQFGVVIECDKNCPINCTPEVKAYTDELYGFLFDYCLLEPSGAILYVGSCTQESEGIPS